MDKIFLSDMASNNFKLPRAVRTKPRNEPASQVSISGSAAAGMPLLVMAAPDVLLYTAVTAVTHVTLCTGSNNRLSQHFDVAAVWQQAEHETEYAVSPNTPLLSTEVQENAWVCGEFAWREHSPEPHMQLPTWLNWQQHIAAAQEQC